jgi:hypothetical protein
MEAADSRLRFLINPNLIIYIFINTFKCFYDAYLTKPNILSVKCQRQNFVETWLSMYLEEIVGDLEEV